ncbi:hypothetical protein ACFVZA_22665 [Streptomyces bottropensis]|uniref:hypothetical protein n=1 Tax=Streptomyces bottropensis TaxID=42235 RepID=UPI0036D029D2
MPSSSQHAAPTPSDPSGAVAEDLALYREKFRRRLPESLDVLHGPTQGIVDLPLHMAWSGMTSYDEDLLLHLWPVLRTLVGRTVRAVWEDAFPQLASRARATA